jgi:hypothetical protein
MTTRTTNHSRKRRQSTAAIRTGSFAWAYGTCRAVYLGPDYLADWANYTNESLLDGSTPNAREVFLRSVCARGNDHERRRHRLQHACP